MSTRDALLAPEDEVQETRPLKYWQAVNTALREEMARDPDVCYIGEDVGIPGGPFSATRGLQDEFGASRVRDTPISEATIVGAAAGAAMTGLRPVVEVMFFDFITLTMDQLVNQAAKIRYMSGGAFRVPMTVRTMCGAGRGSGPQHSQSLEAWLAHVPGLKVVKPSNPNDARTLLKAAIRDDNPVIVIDDITLWSKRGEVATGDDVDPLGTARTARRGSDVTIVAWGAAVGTALTAADELLAQGIDAEVLDLRSVNPIDEAAVLESVSRTGRVLVVQLAVGPCSVASEVLALVSQHAHDHLRSAPVRLTAAFAPVPFAPALEQHYYPTVQHVVGRVRSMFSRTGALGAATRREGPDA